ncbi:hypothetical protein MPSEU_000702900 [Mayamaea pseudoterrestris]|nr:hypothetical protein MPSEU_000702900 [Mayamaea pseudoterrestris]
MTDSGASTLAAAEPPQQIPPPPPPPPPLMCEQAIEDEEDDEFEKKEKFFNDDCLRVWSIVPRLTGTIAWSIAVAFLFDCRFVYLDYSTVQVANATSFITAEPLRFGLLSHAAIELTRNDLNDSNLNQFTLHNTNECLRYSDRLFQSTQEFATAQICAIVCVVLGGFLTWMLWIMYCCRFVCLCIPSIIISLGFLVVLPVLQATTIYMLRSVCQFRLDEPPLLDIIRQEDPQAEFDYTEQTSSCGMSSLYGLYYPVSICCWVLTGLLFLAIRPRKNHDLDGVAMLR